MDQQLLDTMLEVDGTHWWYRGRRRVVAAALDALALPPGARILDAGCGSGASLDQLKGYGRVAGIDLSAQAVEAARSRGHEDVRLGAVEDLPWEDETFDLVTCLDVIEHTADDHAVLAELWRVARPGGHALVTVPSYPALWSAHDVANHHYRRYRRRSLLSAAAGAGWRAKRVSGFNLLLLGPAAAVRLAQRLRVRTEFGSSDLRLPSPRLNGVLELPNRWEARWLRTGRTLPLGLSLLALLEKPG